MWQKQLLQKHWLAKKKRRKSDQLIVSMKKSNIVDFFMGHPELQQLKCH